MDVEIITVGNELLLGHTINTNVAEIARTLSALGGRVTRSITVPDEHAPIVSAIREGLQRADVVITTGGLGPTRDDITKVAAAEALGVALVRNQRYVHELEQRFSQLRPGPMPESNLSQADVPEGGEMLANPLGSAPGLWMGWQDTVLVMLPGVPREMRGLMRDEVVPRLKQRTGNRVIISRDFRTTGISESALADKLAGIEERLAPLRLAFLPSLDGVDLRLTTPAVATDEATEALDAASEWFVPLLEPWYYGADADLAEIVLAECQEAGLTLGCAESCTGGLIGQRLTAVPGSSRVFAGSIVAYADSIKRGLLDVPVDVLAEHGAVSEEVARAMATGCASTLGVDAAVSVTGIAGPGGGTPEKPVGTVHMAAVVRGELISEAKWFPGDRDDVRRRASQAALRLIRKAVSDRTQPANG